MTETGKSLTGPLFDDHKSSCNTQVWINLTASLKDYYESQIKLLEATVFDLARENHDLKYDLMTVQDDFVNQQIEAATQVNSLTCDITRLKDIIKVNYWCTLLVA